MGADAITFRCSCGLIEGSVQPAGPAHGTHVECFCRDCRAARIHLGEGDTAPGGVPIYQTTPDHVHISRGLDNLGLMRLGPEGLFRWYATCCNVTLFNTLPKPSMPFVGLSADRIVDTKLIGPVIAQVNRPAGPDGKGGSRFPLGLVLKIFGRLAAARLSGRWKSTPFFDVATGQPIVAPVVLTKAEREAATPTA